MRNENGNGGLGANEPPGPGEHALSRCLSLDLEVGRNDGRILALAGVRADTGESFTFARRRGLPQALRRLDELAQGADFLLGHNLIDFDLPPPERRQSKPVAIASANGSTPCRLCLTAHIDWNNSASSICAYYDIAIL